MFNNKTEKFLLFVWLIYGIITFFAVLNHEPNRDEAQVWLIVRDLDLPAIYRQLSAMGHPGLWYLILFPFAKLGFPYITMLIIHWLIGASAAWVLLFRANLGTTFKILLLFSYYLLFEYMIPARNYNLTILILFLIAANYQNRFSNPVRHSILILLLFNANTHSFGAAISLCLIFFWEGRQTEQLNKLKFPLLLMSAGLLLFILQMFPALNDSSHNVTMLSGFIPAFDFNSFWVCITAVQNAFIPVAPEYEEIKIALLFGFIFFLFILSLTRKIPLLFFILSSVSWLFYLFITKLSGSWRHEGLILIFTVFVLWISRYYSEKENYVSRQFSVFLGKESFKAFFRIFLCVCFFITMIFGVKSISKEIRHAYSGAEEAAQFIKENNFKEIAAYPSWRATSLAPYIPKLKIWQVERNEYGAAYALDSVFYEGLLDIQVLAICSKKYTEFILVLDHELDEHPLENSKIELLFSNKRNNWGSDDERYFIYSVKFE